MQKIIAFLFIFLWNAQYINAQSLSTSKLPEDGISGENVYIHLNTSTLLVGEYLLFKIYSTESKQNQLSTISKVAYVHIINEEGDVILEQTVALDNGIGIGDFFIPTTFNSGNYKLLGYTNWMRNNSKKQFFSQDIFLINPYTSKQNIVTSDSTVVPNIPSKFSNSSSIKLDSDNYGYREKVSANIQGLEKGHYSVSVRQIDSISGPELQSAMHYFSSSNPENLSKTSIKHLPEIRGKLISGKLKSKKDSSTKIGNVNLALSLPGEDYFFRLGNTNNEGRFFFNIDESIANEQAIIQVIGNNKDDFEIVLEDSDMLELTELKFSNYKITPAFQEALLQRSINNQIENAYFSLKPDTIKTAQIGNIFDGLEPKVYKLDDYKRFKTIPETFVEIIPDARVRQKGDFYEFAVLGKEPYNNFNGSPLVIVDGLFLQDTDGFIRGFDSYKINTVRIIRDKYFLGSMYFKGAILIETINQDFADTYQKEYLKKFQLNSGNLKKQYFKQNYSDNLNNENLPDRRVQLFWNPELDIQSGKFEFYTSDIKGLFEVSIQGITKTGRPVSLKQTFSVQ